MKGLSYPKYQINVKKLRMIKKNIIPESLVTNQFLSDFFEQHEQKSLDKIVIEKEIDELNAQWKKTLTKDKYTIIDDLETEYKSAQSKFKKRTGYTRAHFFMLKEKLKRDYLEFMFKHGYNLYVRE